MNKKEDKKWIYNSDEANFRNKTAISNQNDLEEAKKLLATEKDPKKQQMYKNRIEFLEGHIIHKEKRRKQNNAMQGGILTWILIPVIISIIGVVVAIILMH